LIAPLFAVCLLGFVAPRAEGQSAVVTGKVTNEHGAAISGASVGIKSLNVGTNTNDAGNYTITVPEASVHGQQVVVTARFIGYTPQDMPVSLSAGPHTANFQLKADPFQLNAVVATGVADSTSAKNLTFSMARVTGDQVKDVPASDPIAALSGKVAGAKISAGTGNPGGAPAIRLRGSTCLQVGCSSPLVIVDGVITTDDNEIADLDAQDIANIEILKGAAGASFYGSNAANGVINITTNRGKNLSEGHVSITAQSEMGQSGISHYPDFNHATQDVFNPDGSIQLVDPTKEMTTEPVTDGSGFDDNPYPTSGPNRYRNQMQEWLGSQNYYNNLVSLGLRRGNTNFNSSFSSDHNGGVLPFTNGQFRQNARLNVDQGVGQKADVSASVTYSNQHNDFDPNSSGPFFALYQAPPTIDLRHPVSAAVDTASFYPRLPNWSDPSSRGNPLYGLFTSQLDEQRQHLLGSVSGHYRPTDWLRLEGTYGTDRINSYNKSYTPRGTLNSAGNPGGGSLSRSTEDRISWNSMFRATATKLYKSLLSTTSGAYQMENLGVNSFNAGGSNLTVNGVPDLDAIPQDNIGIGSNEYAERTTDYMFLQSFDLKDRYIVDGLYRRDGSSLFGPQSRWSNFYRFSGAYRVTQDFHIPGVQELKLHAARGTAGLRPSFSWQYETYQFGSGGTFSPATLGNKNLKPAILTENEFGVNADFLDRFSAELTYADRLTKDAFLNVPLSIAATGGFTSQWQNAADISSKTLEGSLQSRLLDRRNFTYDVTFTADHTTQQIEKMNRAPYRVSAGGQGQNVFWYQPGLPLGIIYGQKFVHTFAQLTDNPKNAGADPNDYVVNPLGFLVKKSLRGTAGEVPITYVDATGNTNFVIGNVNPAMNYGLVNDFRIGDFNIHAGLEGQRGGDIYNFTAQWQMQDLRNPDIDMSKVSDAGCPGVDCQKIAEGFFSGPLYNNLNASEYFVESGAYLKLQELSAAYNVPSRYLPKVGLGRASGVKLALIGRNLITWTSYSGFDPDITSGSDFNYKIDGFRYPPFRTITGQVQIRF
jgi:TonB-linked SusC/RagA family outer membrane protein